LKETYTCLHSQDLSVELDQVLKDKLTPAISARLHKQSAFRKPAEFDGGKTELFRERTNLVGCAVIIACQEHNSPAAMYGRILVKNGSDQMVEAFNQFCTSEACAMNLEEGCPSRFSGGNTAIRYKPLSAILQIGEWYIETKLWGNNVSVLFLLGVLLPL
jgi:hypothetical protein